MNGNIRNFIANFSLFFVKRYRITILLFAFTLFFGFIAYNNLLKREGFPSVDIPYIIIETPYFVDDQEKVNHDVTVPIEHAILDLNEIETLTSQTTNNFSVIVAEFNESYSSDEGKTLILDEIDKEKNLEDIENITLRTVDAGKFNGEHDFILTLAAKDDQSINDRQDKAATIAEEIAGLTTVQDAAVIELVSERTNPSNQEKFEYQESFNRVGIRETDDGKERLKIFPAISIGINKEFGADTIKLSEEIRAKIDELGEDEYLTGYEVVYTGDTAVDINNQLESLQQNAVTGLIAVVIIVFLFVSLQAALLSGIFIVTVMAATFVGLYAIGYSLNVISLFALILVLGLLVDDAIVVVEAINYKVRQGFRGTDAIKRAIKDIGLADILGTITTLLVFAPMAFASGILGEFIRLIPITVILALSLSIAIALTAIPFLANILLAFGPKNSQQLSEEKAFVNVSNLILVRYDIAGAITAGPGRVIRQFGNKIAQFVSWYLATSARKYLVIFLTVLLIALGGMYATNLTFSVFPSPKDADSLMITTTYPTNTEIKTAEEVATDIESILIDNFEDETDRIDYFYADRDSATILVNLIDMNVRTLTASEIQKDLQKEFDDLLSKRNDNTQIKVELLSAGPPSSDYPFAMQIFDDDPKVLEKASRVIEGFLTNREIEDNETVTEVSIDNTSLISKRDGRRYIQVKAKISDVTNTGLILTLRDQINDEFDEDVLEKINLKPDALEFDFGQESENLQSFESTIVALAVALVIMYLLLITQYNSYLQPVLILLAIPFSFPGLFPGLFFTDNSMSFFSVLGMMALAGVVVNNTIILVDFANRKREEGLSTHEAISTGVKVRFRPIVATTATTVAGLLPLGLSDPFWESIAFSIIFGLTSSTILVLLAFPAFYSVFEDLRKLKTKLPGYHAIQKNLGADEVEIN